MALQRYSLEVYFSDDYDTPLVSFDSEHPFPAISRGDLLESSIWDISHMVTPDQVLKIARVLHMILDREEGPAFKTIVYTRAIAKNRSAFYADD